MPKVQLPSTPRGRKRLLRLADMLMKNSRNKKGARFDYGDWGTVDNAGQKPKMNCGTTGCALGLAAISGRFRGLGFYIEPDSYHIQIGLDQPGFDPRRGSTDHIEVGAKYFEITLNQSSHIFGGNVPCDDNNTEGAKAERTVAKAIRQFVKGKYKPLMSFEPDPDEGLYN